MEECHRQGQIGATLLIQIKEGQEAQPFIWQSEVRALIRN
jgi:hypothetical protein